MHLHAFVKFDAFALNGIDVGSPHGRAITPPVIGIGTPVVAGYDSGRPFRPRAAKKPKACASMASEAQPTVSAASTVADPTRSRSIWSMVRLRAPPPQTIQLRGLRGSSGTMRAMAAAVKAVSVAAPSAGCTSPNFSTAKSLRSSDFGGGLAKNGN